VWGGPARDALVVTLAGTLSFRDVQKMLYSFYVLYPAKGCGGTIMNKPGKLLLQCLLIISLVIEPLAFARAMAGMDPGQGCAEMTQQEVPVSDGRLCASAANTQQQHMDGKYVTRHCCSAMQCFVAVIPGALSLPAARAVGHFLPYDVSWTGIKLPLETKPPRRLPA
jgi:hypothetical protein